MTGATHLLTGSFIYILMKSNIIYSAVFAVGSHFILDAIPHFDSPAWNFPTGFLAVLFLLLTAKKKGDPFFLLSALFGMLPDANHLFCFSKSMLKLHQLAHFKKSFEIPISYLYIEIYACLVICYLIQTRYSKRVAPRKSSNTLLRNAVEKLYQMVPITFMLLNPNVPHCKPEIKERNSIVNRPPISKPRRNDRLQRLEESGYCKSVYCNIEGLPVFQTSIQKSGKKQADKTKKCSRAELRQEKINKAKEHN